jgi:arsenate reductase
MAEAWTKRLHPERFDAYSAGTNPGRLDQRAVRVMEEVGIDISGERSKRLDDLAGIPFDCVITVCDAAREACPVVPGSARQVHVGFGDPPWMARDAVTEEAALAIYRRVRDEIRDYVAKPPELLANGMNGTGTR